MPEANIRFEPIVPKGRIVDATKMLSGLKGACAHWGNIARDDFKKTTNAWKTPVDFSNKQMAQGGSLEQIVGTSNVIYGYIDQGTRAHWVFPRKGGMLAFRSKWRNATRPRVISSSTRWTGGAMAFSRGHRVGGIPARYFAATIADRRERNFHNLCQNAVRDAIQH